MTKSLAPRFRLWPPVALGLPLVIGIVLSDTIGDPFALPDVRRAVGWTLVAAFVGWNSLGLSAFATHRTGLLPGQETRALIESGLFRVSRNPLYVGLLALYAALALLAPSTWALLLTPLAVWAITWGAIRPEETYLTAKFGAEYVDYTSRVRRWL